MSEPIIIIGAGIGGLSAAIHLAARGKRVVVLEKNPGVGGKMAEFRAQGFRWDTGPSVITMLPVFQELFRSAGRSLEDYLVFEPVDPLTRYFYPDGTQLDIHHDLPATLAQIQRFYPQDVEGYQAFLKYAAELHRITGPVFIYDQPPRLGSLFKVAPRDILKVDGLRTVQQAISGYVRSPQLRQLLGRFATYVGASPFLAPATLNVIAHVELNQGVWYPQGGVYAIARALERLALELGVEIHFNSPVQAIELSDTRAVNVRVSDGSRLAAGAIIANLDVALVYGGLLPALPALRKRLRRLEEREPSCSGFILLLGVEGEHNELAHHNIFFSADYALEFEQIFNQGIPPKEPTIYATITSKSTPGDAPAGCENWFVLVNAPALDQHWDWLAQGEAYTGRVLDLLTKRGFDLRSRLRYQKVITPLEIEQMTGARRGALYGASSNNRWAAFMRPHNRCPEVQGLYFAGGTVHPGGGVPMAALSGKVASQLLLEDGY
jgi:diapolycopene oxygenase